MYSQAKELTLELKGAVVLVTGGAKGLGLAISTYLEEKGALVMVADLDAEASAALPETLERYVLDVTRPDDAKAMVKAAVERHGRIDVFVNNVGVIYSEPMVNIMNSSGMCMITTDFINPSPQISIPFSS